MENPAFANCLTRLFESAPEHGIKNALQLAKAIGASPSTVSRHVTGDILPTRDILGRMVDAFPEEDQIELLRAYMIDCLPPPHRHRVRPEIGGKLREEDLSDDIAAISIALESFKPEHRAALRYLVERAATQPGIMKAMLNVVAAMRGQ